MRFHEAYTNHRVPAWALVLFSGTLAVTACSGPSRSTPATAASSVSSGITNGSTDKATCLPKVHTGDILSPSDATPLFVLAGIAELPDGEYVGHPAFVRENNQWDVATLRNLGGTAWQLVNPTALSNVHIFVHGPANPIYDGCVLSPGVERPIQGQVVTITGTAELPTGQAYPSFYNDSQNATSADTAFEDMGAVGIPINPPLPPGYQELSSQ